MSPWESILVFETLAHHDRVEVLLGLAQVAVPLNGIANDYASNAIWYVLIGGDLAACSSGLTPLGVELLLMLNLLQTKKIGAEELKRLKKRIEEAKP